MRKVKNEKYIATASAVVGIIIFFFNYAWALALGIGKTTLLLQRAANWFFASVIAVAFATIVFTIGACVFFDKATALGQSSSGWWELAMLACFALAAVSVIACMMGFRGIEPETDEWLAKN